MGESARDLLASRKGFLQGRNQAGLVGCSEQEDAPGTFLPGRFRRWVVPLIFSHARRQASDAQGRAKAIDLAHAHCEANLLVECRLHDAPCVCWRCLTVVQEPLPDWLTEFGRMPMALILESVLAHDSHPLEELVG